MYVSDETGRDVVVIDPESGTVVGRIEVGKRPRGVRLTHDGKQLLIALSGSPIGGPNVDESKLPPADRAADGIGVVDVASGKLVQKYTSGQDPEAFDISPDDAFVFVSNEDAAEMSVIERASGTITHRVKVGEEPEGVKVRPDGKVVYVTCEGDNEVIAVDTSTYKVVGKLQDDRAAAVGRLHARQRDSIHRDRERQRGRRGGFEEAQGPRDHQVPPTAGTPAPPRPMGTAISADGSQVYVTFGRAQSVGVIDVKSRKLTRTFEKVGARPWGIGISPDGRKLYTANGPSGDVSIIDIATGVVEKKVSVGGSPWGIAVSAGTSSTAAPSGR